MGHNNPADTRPQVCPGDAVQSRRERSNGGQRVTQRGTGLASPDRRRRWSRPAPRSASASG